MSKESSYTLLQKKKWRAITYDWEVLSTYQPTSRLYCLTDFQVAWLLSNTQYMRWSTRWENCPCTDGDLDKMAAEMEYNLMSCFDLQPYQLDFLYEDALNRAFEAFEALYDEGGIAELNPNTPTDYYNGDDSPARNYALCMACETYVKSYAQRWLQQANLINSALNIIVGIISPVPYLQNIAIEVIAGLIGIDQAKVDAMQDNDALDAVVCCMEAGLNGGAVNQTIFEECLDGCGFLVDSEPYIVQQIIGSDLDLFNNWLTFLNALGDAYTYTEKGIVFECPCDDEWVSVFNFDTGQQGWVNAISTGWTPDERGQFEESTDEWIAEMAQSDVQKANGVYIEISFDSATITQVSILYDAVRGTFNGGLPDDSFITYIKTAGGSENNNIIENIQTGDDQTGQDDTPPTEAVNQIFLNLICSRTNLAGTTTGDFVLKQITIAGTGVKPSQFP